MPIDDDYYARIKEANMSPVWQLGRGGRRVKTAPHIWRWELTGPMIREAAEGDDLESIGHRRALSLVNPGFEGQRHGTISTASAAIQLIKPGEVATAHRHPAAALRFIMMGSDAYTIVDGEKMFMEEGDLVLTPTMMYHDHAHAGFTKEPMIWMDVLESPLVQYLEVMGGDEYPEDVQPVTRPAGYTASLVGRGFMRPFGEKPPDRTLPLAYKWADAYGALLESVHDSPFDGVAMEYINPLDGGHTLPSVACALQRLRPAEHTQAHRHNHAVVYNVAKGSGFSVIDGLRIDWGKHDVFCVPAGTWHEHANADSDDDAVLFSISDLPVVEAVNYAREEEGTRQEVTGAL